ncbi:MAG: alpha/beta hydrolase [Bacillota bacterium]
MRRKNWWLAGGALAIGASQSLVAYAFEQVTRARRQTNRQCLEAQEAAGVIRRDKLAGLVRRRVEIWSEDGLRLRGWLLPGEVPIRKVIILVHGYTACSSWMVHLALPFVARNWTALLIDQRSHGASEGRYATYGHWEKYDLRRWVNWVVQQYGDHVVIGLLGQSMGGGTVLQYAALNRWVDFIVADCAYSDMRRLIKHQISNLHRLPPSPLLQLLDRRLQRTAGFRMQDVCPLLAIRDQEQLPVMFIHGGKDDFVPTEMSIEMYEQKRGKKQLLIVPEAGHVQSYMVDPITYERQLFAFIAEAIGEPGESLSPSSAHILASQTTSVT